MELLDDTFREEALCSLSRPFHTKNIKKLVIRPKIILSEMLSNLTAAEPFGTG